MGSDSYAKLTMQNESPKQPTVKKPFLLGQPLFHLVEQDPRARWQAVISEAEPRDELRKNGFVEARQPASGGPAISASAWQRKKRVEFMESLADPPLEWRRVALVCSAGLGKTQNLKAFEWAINQHASHRGKQLAFFVDLEKLPGSADELVEILAKQMQNKRSDDLEVYRREIKRRRHQGRITLLLDSLDQAGADPKGMAVQRLDMLVKSTWQACPIWVSGRPHAFEGNKELFLSDRSQYWQFLRIGQLEEKESRFLLDAAHAYTRNPPQALVEPVHLYNDLSRAAQRLTGIPRLTWLMARLSPETLKTKLSDKAKTTAADVYWFVYNDRPESGQVDCSLLYDGLKAANRMAWRPRESDPGDDYRFHQVQRARDLLGAIAFQMLSQTDKNGKIKPAFNGVHDDLDGLKTEVSKRFDKANALVNNVNKSEDSGFFFDDWNSLLMMDSVGLGHFIFSGDSGRKLLRWGDITTMAFFAAYWASRWATPEERKTMAKWVVDPIKQANEEFREFWTFAAEMPEAALQDHLVPRGEDWRTKWLRLFKPFYDGRYRDRETKRPIRSTEFIYRSWERMSQWRRDIIKAFQGEFQQILADDVDRKKQELAQKLIAGFIPLLTNDKPRMKGQNRDNGNFTMGEGEGQGSDCPDHPVTLTTPFTLHRFCVTNLEYELFDPRHKALRWWHGDEHPDAKKKKKGADDHCPVVMVSWYDVWSYVKWLNEFTDFDSQKTYRFRLPTEAQWEYACRAGWGTSFSFKAVGKEKCTATECNFGFDDNFGTGVEQGPYHKRTSPVDAMGENPWGFWQMHGNVWEWCFDWYAADFYTSAKGKMEDPVNDDAASARVLRGGGWGSNGRSCRSAYRFRVVPDNRYFNYGFRLAAVPR